MNGGPYEPTSLTDDAALIRAELCVESALDERATIPFCFPAPPRRGLALALVAGLVIAVNSFAAGYCVATILTTADGGNIILAMIGLVFFSAVAGSQLSGVFRPHGERANFAGNLLIGSAAMVAAGLTAIPMIAGQAIELDLLLGCGGMTVFLAIAGHMNLAWSRQLRSAEWRSPAGWTFSLRELLAIFTAFSLACAGYLLCTRLADDARFRERQLHEIWRVQRISDVQSRRRPASPAPVPAPIPAPGPRSGDE